MHFYSMNSTVEMQSETETWYQEWFLPIRQDLERYILHLTRNKTEAKELMSALILELLIQRRFIKDLNSIKSYSMTIVRRMYFKEKSRRLTMIQTPSDEFDELFECHSNQEQQTDAGILYNAVGKLSEPLRDAIILSEIMDIPHKEIAIIQNTSIAAVKVRVFRAKQQLRKLLSGLYD